MKVQDSEEVGLKFNIQKTKIMVSGPISSWQIDGETMETVTDFIFLGCKVTVVGDSSHDLKDTCSLEENLWPTLDSILKNRDTTLLTTSQSYGFSSSHVWMWQLDYKESWVPKNWCFWTVVLEKTLDSQGDPTSPS